MKKIEVIIKEDGKTVSKFTTDTKGNESINDLNKKIVSIIGEKPLREERR
jgi:hypothetical protein